MMCNKAAAPVFEAGQPYRPGQPASAHPAKHNTVRQAGVGSLPVVLLLLMAATLVVLYANRAVILEIRSAANQVRASLALEAANAGLAWATAQLHNPSTLNAACQPDAAASGTYLDRYLPVDPADPQARRRSASARAGCVLEPGTGWLCACPEAGVAALSPPTPASDAPAPAFLLRFADGPRAGTAWLHSQGCSSALAPCGTGTTPSDATRQVSTLLGLLPALARAPYATLSSLGPLQAEGDVQVSHASSQTGWLMASSSSLTIDSQVRLIGAPGQPGSSASVSLDARGLNSDGTPLSAATWFARHFALSPAAYRSLPHVHVLACGSTCTSSDLRSAINAGHRVLWADGNLLLDTPDSYGSLTDPVVLIVQGSLQLSAAVALSGYAHAGTLDWQVIGTLPGTLQGALNSASTLHLAGPLRLHGNPSVLARLRQTLGTWAPAPGSWTDFGD